MPALVLSRTQRNEIFERVRRLELDPSDFAWSSKVEGKHKDEETLTHSPTGSWFKFSHGVHGGWWMAWQPTFRRGVRHESANLWNDVAGVVQEWLVAVRNDHTSPDLWGELTKEKTIPAAADRPEYQQAFSPVELKQLETALADIERYIGATQPLAPAEKEKIHSRFVYLLDAAKAGARKIDWLNIFIAQVVAMVISGLLDAKVYGPLMAHAATVLNAVFQFGIKLLN